MLKPAFVDLSHHNTIPQSLVPARNAGILGVIHKVTEGTGYVDDKCKARFALAGDAGMLWGLYHFVRPGNMDTQVDHFLGTSQQLGVATEDTLFCLDWEDSGVSGNQALDFLQQVKIRTGNDPVLYSGHVLKEDPNPALKPYRLWLCHYTSGTPTLPKGWEKYWAWQYTDQGSCAGINSPVDLNAYDGTVQELRGDWSGRGPVPEPEPEPEQVVVNVTIEAPAGVIVKVNGVAL